MVRPTWTPCVSLISLLPSPLSLFPHPHSLLLSFPLSSPAARRRRGAQSPASVSTPATPIAWTRQWWWAWGSPRTARVRALPWTSTCASPAAFGRGRAGRRRGAQPCWARCRRGSRRGREQSDGGEDGGSKATARRWCVVVTCEVAARCPPPVGRRALPPLPPAPARRYSSPVGCPDELASSLAALPSAALSTGTARAAAPLPPTHRPGVCRRSSPTGRRAPHPPAGLRAPLLEMVSQTLWTTWHFCSTIIPSILLYWPPIFIWKRTGWSLNLSYLWINSSILSVMPYCYYTCFFSF